MVSPKNTPVKANPAPKKPYHHGDLREALIDAGIAALNQSSAADLSLRQLARDTGVSPTAVYRHFSDKAALLRAIAARGFAQLGALQAEAAQTARLQSGAPAAFATPAFAASGAAYVQFALANPATFRQMFTSAPPTDLFTLPLESLSTPLRLLRENVTAIAPPNTPDTTKKIIAIRAWALVHGLAVLAIDKMIPQDPAFIAAVINSAMTS